MITMGMDTGIEREFKGIPERDETDPASRWRLEDLFPGIEEWEASVKEVRTLLSRLGNFQGRLSRSPEILLECLRSCDRTGELTSRIYAYAHMKSHEDTRNSFYQSLSARATSLAVEASSSQAFVTPEILEIPEETVSAFIDEEPGLRIYRFFLDEILRKRGHVLSQREEVLLASSGEMAQAPETIFSMLTNADMSFPPIRDEQGKETPFSEERFGVFLQSVDRRVREDAYNNLYRTYGNYRNTLSASLNAALRGAHFYSRARGFGSSLESALHGDDIPVPVYSSLVSGVRERLDLLHRYVNLRGRILGLSPVRMFDLYVPLVPEYRQDIPFDEAMGMIMEGLKPMGPRYIAALEEGFAGGWIDVFENRGKRGGAYSWGAYPVHPYVLLNYNNRIRDVFTTAHEMGHAMHKYFTDRQQPFVYAGHSIFLAEVASTTNESLLLEHLTASASDPFERMFLLNYRLEQIRTTVFRQTMFAEFERMVHNMIENGEAPTAEDFCSVWRELNKAYYGTGVEMDAEIEMEWSRIPHFYSPFYVYQYATGYSAATALSRSIIEEGSSAAERYIRFLERGRSAPAIEVLREAGVDMTRPDPVFKTLDLFADTLDEFEKMVLKEMEADK